MWDLPSGVADTWQVTASADLFPLSGSTRPGREAGDGGSVGASRRSA